MALHLPNDKVVYSLPEQVAVNTKNIEYLAEVYHDIDELPSLWESYKEEINGILGDYDDTMAGYALTMGGYQTTMDGYALPMGGYQTTMDGYALLVNTWANNIAAAAVGAISGQAITPLTVAQTQANSTADLSGNVTTELSANLTRTDIYCVAEEINGVLHIIFNTKYLNNTAATVSITVGSSSERRLTSLSAAVASKIFDIDGQPVSVNGGGTLITKIPALFIKGKKRNATTSYTADLELYNEGAMGMFVVLRPRENFTIDPNEEAYFCGRISLTLI